MATGLKMKVARVCGRGSLSLSRLSLIFLRQSPKILTLKGVRTTVESVLGGVQTKYRLVRPHTLNGRRHHGHQPLCEERVGSKKLFLNLHTVSAPSGEERTCRVHPHRSNALRYASAA
jgi:hypothetical protein